jgi:hypothetical protein
MTWHCTTDLLFPLIIKSTKGHSALETNYGRKIILGPDRHQQRKRDKLKQSLDKATERALNKAEALEGQQAEVAESEANEYGKRLEQRQRAQVVLEEKLKTPSSSRPSGPSRARPLGRPIQTMLLEEHYKQKKLLCDHSLIR